MEIKRTALLATSLFLALNGYEFQYPADSVEKVVAIAEEKLDIPDITRWLRKNSRRTKKFSFYR